MSCRRHTIYLLRAGRSIVFYFCLSSSTVYSNFCWNVYMMPYVSRGSNACHCFFYCESQIPLLQDRASPLFCSLTLHIFPTSQAIYVKCRDLERSRQSDGRDLIYALLVLTSSLFLEKITVRCDELLVRVLINFRDSLNCRVLLGVRSEIVLAYRGQGRNETRTSPVYRVNLRFVEEGDLVEGYSFTTFWSAIYTHSRLESVQLAWKSPAFFRCCQ